MKCNDCTEREATTIVLDVKDMTWYKICDSCIAPTDMVCPFKSIEQ